MNSKEHSRRRFLKESAALAGLAVGAIPSASAQYTAVPVKEDWEAYGMRSRFDNSARVANTRNWGLTPPFRGKEHQSLLWTPLQDQTGIITPSGLHYAVTHSDVPFPDIDPRQHRLLIHGLVDRPLIFTLEELKRLPSVMRILFLECNSNTNVALWGRQNMRTAQYTHGFTSCSEWTGVPLSVLLREAGVQKGASWIIAEAADQVRWQKSIPLSKAMHDAIVAYGQNGEVLRREQGCPLRLMVPGWEAINSVKWLRRIKVVDQPYMARAEVASYVDRRPDGTRWFRFEMGPKSVILRPSGGQQVPGPGFYEITGLAWSGGGAVRRVEVSTDGGRTWKDAQLQEPVLPMAHTRFRLDWHWDGEEAVLQSRCTDEVGQVQPTLAEFVRAAVGPKVQPNEAAGWGHCNAIQPWMVNRNGSVHNEMFS